MKNSLPLLRSRRETPKSVICPCYFGVEEERFTEARYQGKGSHTALIRTGDTGPKLLVIVPKRDILPIGTLLSIMRQGKFTREEFIEILTG